MRHALAALALALSAPHLLAQEPASVYQTQPQKKFQLLGDGLVRKEWLRDLFPPAPDQDRWTFQLRPRLEGSFGWLRLGVGGDFDYGSDENTVPPPGLDSVVLLRDNFKSRDARLDLAFGSIEASWIRAEGGRFRMPVALTEMLWDRDLRPQGAAATLRTSGDGTGGRFALTALWAEGSHVFLDEDTQMWLFSGSIDLPAGNKSRLELVGSYLTFDDIGSIEPMIRRQNTRVLGEYIHEYHVVDGIVRLRSEGPVPTEIVFDYAWNTAVDDNNRGLWLTVALGSVQLSRSRLEYTYAKVDTDAVLAAYAGDDFFWQTGWEGHRGDLAVRGGDHSSFHTIGQFIKFKDSPRLLERDHWIERYRVELRIQF